MIPYVKRTREVYQKLKGCPAQREVYDAIDFHRSPHGNVSDAMTYSKLAVLSGTDHRRIPLIINQLIEKRLIQKVITQKKYVFRYILLDITEPDVVKLPSRAHQVDEKTQSMIDALP